MISFHRIPVNEKIAFLFALLLVIAAYLMFQPLREGRSSVQKRVGYWDRSFGQYRYRVNLWLTIPFTAVVGFFAGMIGISGGSFKVPLMVLVCGVPVRIAVGTSSAMVALTACMGFTGHVLAGDFQATWILPLVLAAVAGGILGGKISLKVKPNRLKNWFACTTLAAAVFMGGNALITK